MDKYEKKDNNNVNIGRTALEVNKILDRQRGEMKERKSGKEKSKKGKREKEE